MTNIFYTKIKGGCWGSFVALFNILSGALDLRDF